MKFGRHYWPGLPTWKKILKKSQEEKIFQTFLDSFRNSKNRIDTSSKSNTIKKYPASSTISSQLRGILQETFPPDDTLNRFQSGVSLFTSRSKRGWLHSLPRSSLPKIRFNWISYPPPLFFVRESFQGTILRDSLAKWAAGIWTARGMRTDIKRCSYGRSHVEKSFHEPYYLYYKNKTT